jgi:hypothetical protein
VSVEGVIWTAISAGSLDGDLKLIARSMEEYNGVGDFNRRPTCVLACTVGQSLALCLAHDQW